MRITWLGHAGFEIEDRRNVVIDPFIKGNPLAPDIELEPDIMAVTHGHADHLGDAVEIAQETGATLVAIHEIANYAAGKGVEAEGMNMGGTIEVNDVQFTMTQAWHSSGIDAAEFGFSGGDPAGYVIEDRARVYHAGDTALFSDMRLIGDLYRPEVMLVPIGDRFTMGPREAALAVSWVRPEIAIPMHYDTFEAVEQDPDEFAELVEGLCDTEVVVLEPGETLEL